MRRPCDGRSGDAGDADDPGDPDLRTVAAFDAVRVVAVVLAANAAITAVHFGLIFGRLLPVRGELAAVTEVAVADACVTIVPSLVAACGLWRLRPWAWPLALLVCGGYFHGMILLLTRAGIHGRLGAMNAVAVYFLAVSAWCVAVLWRERARFGHARTTRAA